MQGRRTSFEPFNILCGVVPTVPTLPTSSLVRARLLARSLRIGDQWLAAIPDFNTLIANSQTARKPVFALTKEDVGRVGTVWDNTAENIEGFRTTFDDLARRIEILTGATT